MGSIGHVLPPDWGIERHRLVAGAFAVLLILETIATLPGDLGLIPIAEALKSATSRTGGKPNVIARGPEPCSPGISRARSRIGPGSLATVSDSLAFIFVAKMDAGNVAGRAQREIATDDQSVV